MTFFNCPAILCLFNERAAIATVASKIDLRLHMNPPAYMENTIMNTTKEPTTEFMQFISFTNIDYGMAESDMIDNKQCSSAEEFRDAFPSEITVTLTTEEYQNVTNALRNGTINKYAFEMIHDASSLMPRGAHVDIRSVGFSEYISFEDDYIQMGTLIRFVRGYIRLGEMMNLLTSQGLNVSMFDATKWHLKVTTDRYPPAHGFRG